MCLAIRKDRQPMTTPQIVIYMRSCGTLSGPVLTESKFLVVLRTMLTFTKTFEREYRFMLIEGAPKTIERIAMNLDFSDEQV